MRSTPDFSTWLSKNAALVALDTRLILLNNIATAMGGGVSPFDQRVKQHSLLQAEVMMHLRYPQDLKSTQNKELEDDAKRLEFLDMAMYGEAPILNPETGLPYGEEDEYDEYAGMGDEQPGW